MIKGDYVGIYTGHLDVEKTIKLTCTRHCEYYYISNVAFESREYMNYRFWFIFLSIEKYQPLHEIKKDFPDIIEYLPMPDSDCEYFQYLINNCSFTKL